MSVTPFRLTVCFAFCCAMFGSALAWQTAPANPIRRIYVEPFATQAGSEKFREDVITELRKLNSVSLAADESSADAILGGGGEIWIKGYRSHNPQLGKVPANGTAIYTGFLSIELRDKNGQTLWSYLATPPAASEDVSKDLSKLIVKKLVEALEQVEAPSRHCSSTSSHDNSERGGGNFPFSRLCEMVHKLPARKSSSGDNLRSDWVGGRSSQAACKQRRFRSLGQPGGDSRPCPRG